ncbi:hypothetical protein EBT31_22325, partial [bacterium]|nr:hypothetical protein [bacterium]
AARAWAEDNDEPLDCHICEQIRAGYGDNSLDVIRFARHRKYGYDQGYYDGRQLDGKEERAAIVAWLRSDKIVLSMDGSKEDVVASAIEAGEHLK